MHNAFTAARTTNFLHVYVMHGRLYYLPFSAI